MTTFSLHTASDDDAGIPHSTLVPIAAITWLAILTMGVLLVF